MIYAIFTNCQELTEVNIGAASGREQYSRLEEDEVDIFCKKITPKLQKLSLGGCEVKNCHIMKLVERCPNITELYLQDTPLREDCVEIIIKGFFKTLVKLQLPYFYNFSGFQGRRNPFAIDPTKLCIGDLPNLKHFWFRKDNLKDNEEEFLNQMLPKAIINRDDLDIASPNGAFWDIKCERSDIFQNQGHAIRL